MQDEQPTPPTREQIISDNVAMREQEVMQYQINIDNFTRALDIIDEEYIGDDAVSQKMRNEFRAELEQRILDEKMQQARADIVRKALVREMNESLQKR